jgi:hypothetical protein
MRIVVIVRPHGKLFLRMVDHQSKLHQFSPAARISSASAAAIGMTAENRSIRQTSGNLKEFQMVT